MKRALSIIVVAALFSIFGVNAFAEECPAGDVITDSISVVQDICVDAISIASDTVNQIIPDCTPAESTCPAESFLDAGQSIAEDVQTIVTDVTQGTGAIVGDVAEEAHAVVAGVAGETCSALKQTANPVQETSDTKECTKTAESNDEKLEPAPILKDKEEKLLISPVIRHPVTPSPEVPVPAPASRNTPSPSQSDKTSKTVHPIVSRLSQVIDDIRNWIFSRGLPAKAADLLQEISASTDTVSSDSKKAATLSEKKSNSASASSVTAYAGNTRTGSVRDLPDYFDTEYFQGIVRDENMSVCPYLPEAVEDDNQLKITAVFGDGVIKTRKLLLSNDLTSLLHSFHVKTVKFVVGDVEYVIPVASLKTYTGTVVVSVNPASGEVSLTTR